MEMIDSLSNVSLPLTIPVSTNEDLNKKRKTMEEEIVFVEPYQQKDSIQSNNNHIINSTIENPASFSYQNANSSPHTPQIALSPSSMTLVLSKKGKWQLKSEEEKEKTKDIINNLEEKLPMIPSLSSILNSSNTNVHTTPITQPTQASINILTSPVLSPTSMNILTSPILSPTPILNSTTIPISALTSISTPTQTPIITQPILASITNPIIQTHPVLSTLTSTLTSTSTSTSTSTPSSTSTPLSTPKLKKPKVEKTKEQLEKSKERREKKERKLAALKEAEANSKSLPTQQSHKKATAPTSTSTSTSTSPSTVMSYPIKIVNTSSQNHSTPQTSIDNSTTMSATSIYKLERKKQLEEQLSHYVKLVNTVVLVQNKKATLDDLEEQFNQLKYTLAKQRVLKNGSETVSTLMEVDMKPIVKSKSGTSSSLSTSSSSIHLPISESRSASSSTESDANDNDVIISASAATLTNYYLNSPIHMIGSNGAKVIFDVGWFMLPEGHSTKQTLFYVENEKPHKGLPSNPNEVTLIRATKGIFFYPPMILQIINANGTKCLEKEKIEISIVNSTDKQPLSPGNCSCNGNPVINFRSERKGVISTSIINGELELNKFQIGCLTGRRGHMGYLSIKISFVGEDSQFKGRHFYSVPLELGAKGPFTKMGTKKPRKAKDATDGTPNGKNKVNVHSHASNHSQSLSRDSSYDIISDGEGEGYGFGDDD